MSVALTASSSLQEQLPLRASNAAQTTRSLTDFGAVLLAILLLAVLLAGITYVMHLWRVDRQSRRRCREAFTGSQPSAIGPSSNLVRRRRRRRVRRANPSLAETRGLPPRRSSGSNSLHPST